MTCQDNSHPPKKQVAALIQNGFLNVLVQLDKIMDYWHHMLKEFPDHPASSMVSASAPLSLYGALVPVICMKIE